MAKNSMKVLGALTIAAALTMTMMTACSSDDNFVDNRNSEQQIRNAVTVTVGAGISDGALTRSEVVDEAGKRVLTFTTGDRLYVYGEIDATTSVAGYLDMVGSPTNGNKSATFSGTLKAYDISGADPVETTMPAGDPFALCTNKTAKATLIHKDCNTDALRVTLGKDVSEYPGYMYAADVETLMETSLPVQGDYASGTNCFTLSSSYPIINCSLSGVPAEKVLGVGLFYYHEGSHTWIQSFNNNFKSSADGKIDVAFVSLESGNKFWKIIVSKEWTVSDPTEFNRNIQIGTKDLTAKVYSVTRDLTNKTFADATAGDLGKVIGANGSIYDNKTAAEAAGTTAEAMIAYLGNKSNCFSGLAFALQDLSVGWFSPNDKDALLSTFAAAHPVTGGTWRIPSADDIKYMIEACGGSAYTSTLADDQTIDNLGTLNTKLYNAGGTGGSSLYGSTYVLSNTDDYKKWFFDFTTNIVFHSYNSNPNSARGRAVLAF